MRLVIQRVKSAQVKIENEVSGSINTGLLVYIGIESADSHEDIAWLSQKLINLRIFSDTDGKMNLSLKEVGGSILLVSQFTLHASTKKGNRPSFTRSAPAQIAIPLYEEMVDTLKSSGVKVETGRFGADMLVISENDGPVTIWMDSKNRE